MKHLVLGLLLIFSCSIAFAQEEPAPPRPEDATKKTEDELKREEEALREAVRQKELAELNAMVEKLEKEAAELRQSGKDPNLLADTETKIKELREKLAKLQAQKPEEKKTEPKEEKNPVDALDWLSSVEEGMKTAKEKGVNLLVLFTNPVNCGYCKMLFEQTLSKEGVIKLLKTFVLVRIDAWDRGKGQEQAKKYDALSIPNTVLFDSEGSELGRISGFRPEKQYISEISDIRDAPKNVEEGKKKIEADENDPAGYLQLAKGQLAQGKNDDATKNLEKVVELDPKNEKGIVVEAYERLAAICQRSNADKAIEYAKKLFDLDPENKKGYALKAAEMLSNLHAMKRNMEEAIKYVEKIIALDPENKEEKGFQAAFNLGNYYARQGDGEKAAKYFDIARKMDPEDKQGRADIIDMLIAVAPAYKQKWEEAAKGIEKFIETHGKSEMLPRAYWTLADFYRRAGNTEKMEKALDDLVKKFPDSREAQAAKRMLPKGK